MKLVARLLAAAALLVGAAFLLLGLTVAVGVWALKGPVTERATRLFGRIDAAMDLADDGLFQANISLVSASARLDGVQAEQREQAAKAPRGGLVKRQLARTVQNKVAPQLGDARGKLQEVAEAAVVVNSILEDLGNIPMLESAGLDTEQLAEINSGLANVAPAAWELSRLLGDPGPDGDADAQLSRVQQLLARLTFLVGEYKKSLVEGRARVGALKATTFRWITPAAALLSFAGFWVALSQVSLMGHAWSWWKRAGQP